MNIIKHGTWSVYTPDAKPDDHPHGVVYAKRDSDGVDWYERVYGKHQVFEPNSVKVTALKEGSRWIVKVATRDVTMLFPVNQMLLEVTDYVGSDPQADLEGKEYVEVTNTFAVAPPPEPPAHLNRVISRRQFFQKLALKGIITPQEALDAVRTGAIPLAFRQLLDDRITDPNEKFADEMLLSGATEFSRDHILTNLFGAAYGMSPADLDTFFAEAALL